MSVYGFCPQCGAPGKMRERRPNGDDVCERGHKYPSRTALRFDIESAKEQARYQTDPRWADKLVADALQMDEIRRLGT